MLISEWLTNTNRRTVNIVKETKLAAPSVMKNRITLLLKFYLEHKFSGCPYVAVLTATLPKSWHPLENRVLVIIIVAKTGLEGISYTAELKRP